MLQPQNHLRRIQSKYFWQCPLFRMKSSIDSGEVEITVAIRSVMCSTRHDRTLGCSCLRDRQVGAAKCVRFQLHGVGGYMFVAVERKRECSVGSTGMRVWSFFQTRNVTCRATAYSQQSNAVHPRTSGFKVYLAGASTSVRSAHMIDFPNLSHRHICLACKVLLCEGHTAHGTRPSA